MPDNVQNITMSENGVDTVYVTLPDHPGGESTGCVKKMIRLDTVLPGYDIPMVNLDFDEAGKLIGIEIIV